MNDIVILNPAGFIGGAEKSLLEFIKLYSNRINVVIFPFEGILCSELKKIGVEYKIINPDDDFNEISRTSGKLTQLYSFYKYSLKIYKFLKNRKFKYIYSNGLKTNIISVLLKILLYDKKVIWHFRDINSKGINYIFNFLSVFTKNIICNSEYTLSQFFTNKAVLIYNPIFFKNNYNIFKKKNSMFKTKKICILGHITKLKNIHTAILSLKYLDKDYILNIYGECPYKTESMEYKKKLEKIIIDENLNNRVFFHNFNKNVKSIYLENDLLLSVSTKESFGRTAFEALFFNLPVIVSKTGFFYDKCYDFPFIIPLNKLNPMFISEKIKIVFNNYTHYSKKNIVFFMKLKDEFDTIEVNKKIIKLFK
ncbi:MAG: glycosyltransferase [Candidatus Muirbacterium halophilum]|nr:glycosyltransferase [Candidatus Muirbacterium halophilum]MCK9476607.1 glycosyltransferase [Candidatus Muirbacterium halophilum]